MAGRKSVANFFDHGTDTVISRWFYVGDDVPAEVVKRHGASAVLFGEGDEPEPEPEVLAAPEPDEAADAGKPAKVVGEAPPKGGPGSGKDAWAEYARANNVTIEAGANRDDIVDALDDAGIPTE